MDNSPQHTHLREAVEEALKSISENEAPHPKVGAVLVRDGKTIGRAHRGEVGEGTHAEFGLLKKLSDAGVEVAGASLVTTLEPCTWRRNHKPCSDWIIEKGIVSVSIGILDPNPRVYCHGVRKLRDAGIRISYFPFELRAEIEQMNAEFVAQFRRNLALCGTAQFNYTDNDGCFTIGRGKASFTTAWSKASDTSIYTYNDKGVEIAIAFDARALTDIADAGVYDRSSRYRLPKEGQFVIARNNCGYFAVLHILSVRDRDRRDDEDELLFDYWIREDLGTDFSELS